jgi:hypothetical protein
MVANAPKGAWICHKMDHHYMGNMEYVFSPTKKEKRKENECQRSILLDCRYKFIVARPHTKQ